MFNSQSNLHHTIQDKLIEINGIETSQLLNVLLTAYSIDQDKDER